MHDTQASVPLYKLAWFGFNEAKIKGGVSNNFMVRCNEVWPCAIGFTRGARSFVPTKFPGALSAVGAGAATGAKYRSS